MPDQEASLLFGGHVTTNTLQLPLDSWPVPKPAVSHLHPIVLLRRVTEIDDERQSFFHHRGLRDARVAERKGFMSMPPVLKRAKWTNDVDHNGNYAKKNLSSQGPLRRAIDASSRPQIREEDFCHSHFLPRDEEILTNMIQTYCSNSRGEPLVRAAKLSPWRMSLAQTVARVRASSSVAGEKTEYPDLFSARFKRRKKRKRTGNPLIQMIDPSVFVGLGVSLLRIDEVSPQRGVRLRPVPHPLNPFLMSKPTRRLSGPDGCAEEAEPWFGASLFGEMMGEETRVADGPAASSRDEFVISQRLRSEMGNRRRSDVGRVRIGVSRSQRESRSISPVPRSSPACRSVPPKVRLCTNEPVSTKAGKWSVFGRTRGLFMFSADNEIMAFKLPLKTRRCPLRRPTGSQNYS